MTIDVRDASPIFDIVEGGYYVGAWYLAGREQDFLGMVFRNPGETSLQFRYRFRYYLDDKVHFDETEDVKNVYDCDLTGKNEDESIAIVDSLARDLIEKGYLGSRLSWLVKKRYVRRIVRGDHRAMAKALRAMPFTHAKPLKTTKGGN
jgi:hypothetical protein